MVDIPGNNTTTSTVAVGSIVNGLIETGGDHDWFRINLTAGQVVRVALNGTGTTALEDPYLRIRDASGVVIFENDDGGGAFNSLVTFAATYTGVYYIDVAAWDNDPAEYNYTGEYQLKVSNYEPPVLATVAQIADQLTDGYWGGTSHHFTVAQGGSISVNLTALTSEGMTLAREGLRQWSDIIGVSFSEVTQGGQITFDDNEEGAHSSPVFAGSVITSAHVNVSTTWLADYGTGFTSYSFHTYVHEIGHALGLGHAGNYDGNASFPFDALFLNDAWSNSVMSYFAPSENSYFAQLGFTDSPIVTPMLADILAMSQLYGLSTTTRVGNTTYGFNSNAGNNAYNAVLNPAVAYTVFDSGGTDTLDYSGFAQNQTIDLTAGAFSNVGGRNGSVAIAIGTVIENATGGAGNDTLVGNAANNVLNGGAGNDTVSYATATAGVTVNLALAAAQNTIGAGTDTLTGFENVIGSQYGDRLTGGAGYVSVNGGAGNDTLTASADGDGLFGGAGDDIFIGGAGNDEIAGGDGFDVVDYSAASGGVRVGTLTAGANGLDTLSGIERITGSNFDDLLLGADTIIGGAGNDSIGSFSVTAIGGTGNDTYDVGTGTGGVVVEAAGEGIDLVRSFGNYILPANVENLSLHFDPAAGAATWSPASAINGTGNALNNEIIGSAAANQINGLAGADTLTGGGEIDTLTGGVGSDTFRDTAAGLNGDTITDLQIGETIVITDAAVAGFSFSLSGSALTYTGGALTLTGVAGKLVATAASAGGVQLSLQAAGDPSNDFNGDGRSDILWRHAATGVVTSWLGQSNGAFVGNSASFTADNNWRVAGSGDFNGDGRDDVLWRNQGAGVVTTWHGQANATFVGNTASFAADANWGVAGTGDFNGDGRDDVLWRNAGTGVVTTWLGQANGTFVGNSASFTAGNSWSVAGTGDFDGDGRDDVLWRNEGAGVATTWLGQANGTFVGNAASFAADSNWSVAGTGDFNGDSRDDVLWRHQGTGVVTDWFGQASGVFAGNSASFTAGNEWNVVGTGDFNGDGRDDVLWRSDAGVITDWLGQADGGFMGNSANASHAITTPWHVQPDYLLI